MRCSTPNSPLCSSLFPFLIMSMLAARVPVDIGVTETCRWLDACTLKLNALSVPEGTATCALPEGVNCPPQDHPKLHAFCELEILQSCCALLCASTQSTDERHTTNDTPTMISRKELKRDGSTPASIDSSAQDNSSDNGHESSTTTATATTTTVLATTSATNTAEEASHDDAALQPHSRDPLNTDDPKTNLLAFFPLQA